ncbi:Hypothetical predicted protein [Cloeon dipterum]|uniref:MRH domain-containing protein n=1 Tax=Cloeon dipterum TaxID=197152 RepID=A0A8S1D185_9INSE|nr:Hypothetical predicted protein [Cloeon dipterum]
MILIFTALIIASTITLTENTRVSMKVIALPINQIEVWGEWEIAGYDNKLTAMKYVQGDKCDDKLNRSSTVVLQCKNGIFGELSEIKEPSRCQYEAKFSTQLVCHNHSLLIYPWLTGAAKREWDEIYTSYINEHIPATDLKLSLKYLFIKSGLLLKPKTQLRQAPVKVKPKSSLNTCDIQVIQLRTELQSLREENARLVAEMKKLMQEDD